MESNGVGRILNESLRFALFSPFYSTHAVYARTFHRLFIPLRRPDYDRYYGTMAREWESFCISVFRSALHSIKEYEIRGDSFSYKTPNNFRYNRNGLRAPTGCIIYWCALSALFHRRTLYIGCVRCCYTCNVSSCVIYRCQRIRIKLQLIYNDSITATQ